MQQLECESNSITCMSCLYVHVYGNKVIYLSIYLSIKHDVFGLIPHHLEDRVHAGDVIQGIGR